MVNNTHKKVPDSFASRMKGYERVSQDVLMNRVPAIIRVDGKAFSKFTHKMDKPFDLRFSLCMEAAAKRLCREAQNCRLAYFQSDEISLLLTDFRTLTTEPWFKNQVQKICSVAAATATAGFISEYYKRFDVKPDTELPVFDARCFNLPREEVTNYFVWRQRDAERNSVSMLAQSNFSHRDLQGKNRIEMLEMLLKQKNVDWNEIDVRFKRGLSVKKEQTQVVADWSRSKWEVDLETPIFAQNRDYIERFLRDEEDRT